jgi:MoaA/NifB/PqqE/SkfB family radical SAM enzyme
MIEFDWLIHYKCNYRCPYCFFNDYWDEVNARNVYRPYTDWVKAYKKIADNYGALKLTITGGEPVIFPDFDKLIVELNKFAEVSFDTNLSYDISVLENLLSKLSPEKIFIGASFHPSHAKLDDFFKKAMLLKDKGFNFRVHYVTYPEHLNEMAKTKDLFISNGIRFTPIPFRGKYNGKEYPFSFTDAEKKIIYGITQTIHKVDKDWANVQVEQVKSRGKLCAAGQKYARVDNDGTVYPCSHDYTKTGGKHVLGNIFDADFKLNDKPMLCEQDNCPCEFRYIIG